LFSLTFSQNLRRIEEALQRRGVICFVKPTPGVRLAESANFDTSARPRARPETGKFDE
jgi:hypothetical protein